MTRDEIKNRTARVMRVVANLRRAPALVFAVAMLFAQPSHAQEMRTAGAPALAFARYVAGVQERNPFTESGPAQLQIDASLPALEKSGTMTTIRETGASERSEYRLIGYTGDSSVKREVIARYLEAQREGEAMPYSSVAIAPANYKFRYIGSVGNPRGTAYVFEITPRQRRMGLIEGQIWIDAETGILVHQTGKFVKRPSVFIRRIEIARDIEIRYGKAYTRTTRVTIDTRIAGPALLNIIERPLETVETDFER